MHHGTVRDVRRPAGTSTARRTAGRRLGVTAALLAALTGALAACSTPDDPREDLRHTVRRVSMIMAGVATTADTLERLPASGMTADRSLAEAAARVDEAERRILLLDVAPADEPTRRQALRLVREASDDVADTQVWATGLDSGRPAPTAAIRDLANRLLALSDEMRAARQA